MGVYLYPQKTTNAAGLIFAKLILFTNYKKTIRARLIKNYQYWNNFVRARVK